MEGTYVGETSAGGWAFDHSLALLASICLWPCFFMAVILLLTHSWMATTSLTSYECLKGSNALPYLQVRLVGMGNITVRVLPKLCYW